MCMVLNCVKITRRKCKGGHVKSKKKDQRSQSRTLLMLSLCLGLHHHVTLCSGYKLYSLSSDWFLLIFFLHKYVAMPDKCYHPRRLMQAKMMLMMTLKKFTCLSHYSPKISVSHLVEDGSLGWWLMLDPKLCMWTQSQRVFCSSLVQFQLKLNTVKYFCLYILLNFVEFRS